MDRGRQDGESQGVAAVVPSGSGWLRSPRWQASSRNRSNAKCLRDGWSIALDVLGFAADAATILAQRMRTMIPLHIAANVLFIADRWHRLAFARRSLLRCSMDQHHDFSLHSGERQTASEYSAIRADHRYRYEWADQLVPTGGFGLDVFCGNGYGTSLLAKTRTVLGIDGSTEAVEQANAHYRSTSSFFSAACFPFDLPARTFDFVVSLESVEHVEDGTAFFQQLVDSLKPGGTLIFSTPCEDHLPLQSTNNHFHFRHYRLEETLKMASSTPLELVDWAGQDTYEMVDGHLGPTLPDDAMKLKPRGAGQFVIACSRRRSTGLLRRFIGGV